MTVTDDVNRCLTLSDSVDQLNCIRASLGYPPISATTSTTTSSTINYLILGGIAILGLYLITKK